MLKDFLSTTENIPATTDTTITHDDYPKDTPLSRIGILNTGTNNGLAGTGIDGYKVKHNSREIWNLGKTYLRALLEALISPLGGTVPATTDLRYTLPGDLYIAPVAGRRIGFPSGKLSVEIDTNTSSSAGASRTSWLTSDAEPDLVPVITQEAMGIGASITGGRYDINTGEGNLVVGWILPMISATGLTRLRLRRKIGPSKYEDIYQGNQDEIYEDQDHYNPEAITTPFFFKPPVLTDYPDGSYMDADTGAASAAADLIVAVILVPRVRL